MKSKSKQGERTMKQNCTTEIMRYFHNPWEDQSLEGYSFFKKNQ